MAGPRGFFRGIAARVLYAMPATAICWSTYEFFKFYLCGIEREQYKSSISGKNLLQPKSTSQLIPLAIVADKKSQNENKDSLTFVLPSTTTKTKEISTESIPPAQTPSPTSSIKTVCELSSSVNSPTLNLHTRHTNVKNPFDRGLSSP